MAAVKTLYRLYRGGVENNELLSPLFLLTFSSLFFFMPVCLNGNKQLAFIVQRKCRYSYTVWFSEV